MHGTETSQARRIALLAKERPDWPAYLHVRADGTEEAVTCARLDDRAGRLAGAFAERGVGHGDLVGLGLRNSPRFAMSVFAAWKLGAVPVPVRWDVPDWELERLKRVIDPRLYLGPDDLDWIDASAARPVPELPDVVSPHMQGICSSGSTGTPKIILSAAPAVHNPVLSTPMAEAWMPVPRPQTVLVLAPMYHVNAFATLYSLVDGDRLVVMEKFDAALALELIERHRVTTFTATPTMLQRMADAPGADDRDLSSLVWLQQGAAPMPPSLVHRWAELIGPERIVMAYGMTEALGITALRGDEWMLHQGSVGRGLRGTEVRILDADGRDLPPGELGEIFLRAPSYGGSTYLGQAPRLAETPDGFRAVGDMGYLDGDGYLYLVDRRVDMITSGGANVFPAEVEAALIDHPEIADVVVIGLRDAEWGRRVHALVQPADPAAPPTAAEVVAYAKGRLAPYKVPKTVELVDAIPRSAATKVNRGRLVEARGG
ncbi:class I adenylate-forming enzyme family protein [Actinomadura sp. WMMB 499]|uniref:class I adenylate-forming enzyme family protein n=1 Tax=Actinomadura sp. WMMB 499 TaxID=1219491 RepID=UPI001248796D|nr:AMP-binding protein [Actinomadura sp. WMMB 499]QFG21359.1 AMP-binding protein [Actinomadura sp. WMMB 499]